MWAQAMLGSESYLEADLAQITLAGFEEFLDSISVAFIEADFALWRDASRLPFCMVTKDGPVTLRRVDELEDNIAQYLQVRDVMQVDRIYRTPVSLEDCHDGTWIGPYRTSLLFKGQHLIEPYTSSALLVKSALSRKSPPGIHCANPA